MATNEITSTEDRPVPSEARASIRKALAIGLYCYGETVRIRNALELRELEGRPSTPADLTPIDPTGDSTVPAIFADAMLWIECGEA